MRKHKEHTGAWGWETKTQVGWKKDVLLADRVGRGTGTSVLMVPQTLRWLASASIGTVMVLRTGGTAGFPRCCVPPSRTLDLILLTDVGTLVPTGTTLAGSAPWTVVPCTRPGKVTLDTGDEMKVAWKEHLKRWDGRRTW